MHLKAGFAQLIDLSWPICFVCYAQFGTDLTWILNFPMSLFIFSLSYFLRVLWPHTVRQELIEMEGILEFVM